MIPRLLERSDEKFVLSALSAAQRTAALVRLRSQRASLGYVVLLVFACLILGGALQFFTHQYVSEPPPILFFIVLILLLLQQDLTSQIRILEILQRGQFYATSGATPTA